MVKNEEKEGEKQEIWLSTSEYSSLGIKSTDALTGG